MSIYKLPLKNLQRKPVRTFALFITVFIMSFSLLGGTLAVKSLNSGLGSLETRLGADIIVVPDTAKSKTNLENIILQGVPGYFYMDKSYVNKLSEVEGVEKISAQYYLASISAGCCSMPVQIIGYDPETDFSITSWIDESGGGKIGDGDVVVGYNINRNVGGTLTFYGIDCKVAARLDKTGTELDNAVYGNVNTVKNLISASVDMGLNDTLAKNDPEKIVSSVLIKVKDGYSIEQVTDYINIYIRHVQAVGTKNMLSGVADSLGGVSNVIAALMGAVWIFVMILLFVVFSTMINERKKEFAVYRVIGMSRKMLAGMVLSESLILSFISAVLGVLVSGLCVSFFSNAIENQLGLPFLLPSINTFLIFGLVTLAVSVLIGSIAAAYAAFRLSKVDTGLILREGN